MKLNRKKKAFTLTELLVVVIVIGILSAAVLPKFNKVIETRRTTEAEELLTAIRTEQERRCTLDKPYAGYFEDLGDIIASKSDTPKTETKNYSYQLEEHGASATRLDKDYKIAIPSYSDGRLCCEGSYCASLNKNYPLCSELKPEAALCAADLCEVAYQCNPGATETKNCECGSQSRSCSGGCQWSAWSGSCWNKSGGRTETRPCQELQSNLRGTAKRVCQPTCDGKGSCPAWTTSGCSVCKAPAGEPTTRACPTGYSGTKTRTWNTSTCSWNAWQGTCTCNPPAGEPTSQSCPTGYSGTQTRTWNYDTCSWNEWNTSGCEEEGDCNDADYKKSHKSKCCVDAPKTDSVCWTCVFKGTIQEETFDNSRACSSYATSGCPKRVYNSDCERRYGSCSSEGYVCQIEWVACTSYINGIKVCPVRYSRNKYCVGEKVCTKNGW